MKKNIFAILLSVFASAFTHVTHANTIEYATMSFEGLYSTGNNYCAVHEGGVGKMTSTLGCINYNIGNIFFVDVIGTCAANWGPTINIDMSPAYSTTPTSNKSCFCKIVGPFTSNWVRHTGVTFANNLVCATNCGLVCGQLLDTPDAYPDILEELLSTLYR